MNSRSSIIKSVTAIGSNESGSNGPDQVYVVELYSDNILVETRKLPGKNIHYARDVAENWESGIIKLEGEHEQ